MNNLELATAFHRHFQHTPRLIARSPGRINIIGEHTDYNEGFVLPAAIDKAVYAAVSRREDGRIRLYSQDFSEWCEVEAAAVFSQKKTWANYVLGVVAEAQKARKELSGFNLLLAGDVPLGAGLSSSAAVACAVLFALNELWEWQLEKMDMVKMAQRAEHNFAGVRCGIMDMFASMMGRQNHAILLDCRSLSFKYIPLKMNGLQWVLFDSRVKHSLADTGYNDRRMACERGVELVQRYHPEVNSLRDVTPEMLEQHVAAPDAQAYRRSTFVLAENQRVLQSCEALENGNSTALGRLLYDSHEGLSRQYEVSCPELDLLVDLVKKSPFVLGARMMGGGFGGCTLNLMQEGGLPALAPMVADAYRQATGLEVGVHEVAVGGGAAITWRSQA